MVEKKAYFQKSYLSKKTFLENNKLNLMTQNFNPARLQKGIKWYKKLDVGKSDKDTLTSTIIRLVQIELNKIGCKVGPADGIFGGKTSRGIDLYQSQTSAKFQIPKVKDEFFFTALHKRLISDTVTRNCTAKPKTGFKVNNQAGEEPKEVINDLKKSADSILGLFGTALDCTINIALLNTKSLESCAGQSKNQ